MAARQVRQALVKAVVHLQVEAVEVVHRAKEAVAARRLVMVVRDEQEMEVAADQRRYQGHRWRVAKLEAEEQLYHWAEEQKQCFLKLEVF